MVLQVENTYHFYILEVLYEVYLLFLFQNLYFEFYL